MNPLLLLAAAGLVSYLLRILLVVVLPAERISPVVRRGLAHVGPAAMATLATMAVINGDRAGGSRPHVQVLAVLATAVLVRWRGNVAVAIVAAVVVAVLLRTLAG